MPVDVRIPAALRPHTGGLNAVQAEPGLVKEVLEQVAQSHPALFEQIFVAEGKLHRFINVYVNDEDVRYKEGLDTRVQEGDVVAILPAVAGGG